MAERRYHRNIIIQYLFILISNLDLTRGLWMIFLASRGFSLLELGLLEGTFHVTSLLMEVPTGAVADIWGRRISRIAGRVAYLASLVFMFSARSLPFQMIGFVVCALGYNLESGSGDALVYDSLLLDGDEQSWMRVAGKKELIYQAASIGALLVGGLLAVRSYPLIFFLSMGTAVVSILTAFGFVEPVRPEKLPEKKERKHNNDNDSILGMIITSLRTQIGSSAAVIRSRPRIAFLILFSELMMAFIVTLFFYLQNFWKAEGRNEFFIGAMLAAASLVSGISGWRAAAIERRIGERGVLLGMPILLVVSLWGVALTSRQAWFYGIMSIVDGILIVAVSGYLNRLIPSENRATILSFQSMAFSLFMIIIFPVIGRVGDSISLQAAFIGMAGAATLLGIPYLLLFLRLTGTRRRPGRQ